MDNTNLETKLIKCRKCAGPHLTIRCGKTVNETVYEKQLNEKVTEKIDEKSNHYVTEKSNEKVTDKNNNYKKYEKTGYSFNTNKVKISNLPTDVSQYELTNLLQDWGHINRINVKNYHDSAVAYVEFKFKDEVDYFIEALHCTSFDHNIIHVDRIE